MKLPKGHILKTLVKYNLKLNSLEEIILELTKEETDFTGYVRILADKGEYEEELKIILLNGDILGGERKLLTSGSIFWGNECRFDAPFDFNRCGLSIVRLTIDDVDMIRVSHPNCIIQKGVVLEDMPDEAKHRNELMKKYRIKEMSEEEITTLLEKLNND
jgi:hypothetical protein